MSSGQKQTIQLNAFQASLLGTTVLGLSIVLLYWKPWTKNTVEPVFLMSTSDYCINEICLKKENDRWIVKSGSEEFQADFETADNFQKTITKIRLEELVSENPERFKDMGIGTDNKVLLKTNGVELEIGNITNEYDGSFVRLKDDNKVFQTKEILSKVNLIDINKWKLKYLTNLPVYQITKVKVENEKGAAELENKDGKWENQKIIESIAYLPVVNQLKEIPSGKELQKINIETEGATEVVYLGKYAVKGKKTVYWASKDKTYYYEIDKSVFETLTGKIK